MFPTAGQAVGEREDAVAEIQQEAEAPPQGEEPQPINIGTIMGYVLDLSEE